MYYISANLAFGRREKKYFNFLNFKHYVFVGRQKNSGGGGGAPDGLFEKDVSYKKGPVTMLESGIQG